MAWGRPPPLAECEEPCELARGDGRAEGRKLALTAKIDDFSTGREIGVKMTSAIGNLAGHPFKLVRLFKSTDYVYE